MAQIGMTQIGMTQTRSRRQRRRRKAFTLLEVMLVLTILMILGGMVTVGIIQMQRRGNQRAALIQLQAIEAAMKHYYLDMSAFPPSFAELRQAPGTANASKWAGPYMEKEIPADPWQNQYQYEVSGETYKLSSAGPDGTIGTPDDIIVSSGG